MLLIFVAASLEAGGSAMVEEDRDAGGLRPGKRLLLHAVATLLAIDALPVGNLLVDLSALADKRRHIQVVLFDGRPDGLSHGGQIWAFTRWRHHTR